MHVCLEQRCLKNKTKTSKRKKAVTVYDIKSGKSWEKNKRTAEIKSTGGMMSRETSLAADYV